MAKVNYDLLYEQLKNLLHEAPCRGNGYAGDCVGDLDCKYGINVLYGCKCAIAEVMAGMIYKRTIGE